MSADAALNLVMQSQQRVEQLLYELTEAQRSSESALIGVQRRLDAKLSLCGRCGVVKSCSGDGPALAHRETQCSTVLRCSQASTATQGIGVFSMADGPGSFVGGPCVAPPNPGILEASSREFCEKTVPEEFLEAPQGVSGGGDQAVAMSETMSSSSSMREQLSSSQWLSRVQRRLPSTNAQCQRMRTTTKSGNWTSFASDEFLSRSKRTWKELQDPNSFVHVPWGLLGLTLLVMDLTITPYILAWNTNFSGWLFAFSCISAIYWALDIVVNLCLGFYHNDRLVTDFRTIASRYARSMLVPDALIVSIDWISVILLLVSDDGYGHSGSFRLLRFAKLGRLIRLMNLLRVLRYVRILSRLAERILSERMRLILQVCTMSMLTLWFNHLIACLWYAIGRQDMFDVDRRWADDYHASEFEEYVVSFHWALAQITLGSIDIVSQNWAERVFNIICLFIGLVVGTTLISTLSATMVEFQMVNKDRNMKLRLLRQYLQENSVKGGIALLVQQQVVERMQEHRRLLESQVPALDMLSSSLRTELRIEIVRPYLFKHQCFAFLSVTDFNWCVSFCKDVFSVEIMSMDDELFLPCARAKAAYVLMRGGLTYELGVPSKPAAFSVNNVKIQHKPTLEDHPHVVAPSAWLAEGTLWVGWVHVGRAVATEMCQVIAIEPDEFCQNIQQFPFAYSVACEYGKQYHQKIMDALNQLGGDPPTDLAVPCTEWDDIVLSMSEPLQHAISRATVDFMESSSGSQVLRRSGSMKKGRSKYDILRDEISEGKCVMVVNKLGIPERIVSVVALNISREDGCMLAQIGKWEPGQSGVAPGCELPGAKRESSEFHMDTLRRLLSTRLKPLSGSVRVLRTRRLITTKSSRRHQVKTKYIRYVFDCDLQSEFEAPFATVASSGWSRRGKNRSECRDPRQHRDIGIAASSSTGGQNLSSVSMHALAQRCQVTIQFSGTSDDRNEAADAERVTKGASATSLFSGTADSGYATWKLLDREVFFFSHDGKGAFYAWLSREEFNIMSKPTGEPILYEWLRALGDPPLDEELSEFNVM